CGLEIAQLENIFDKDEDDEFDEFDELWQGEAKIFIDFFHDDKIGTTSIKFKDPEFQLNSGAKISNNLIVNYNKDDQPVIYDIHRYLKEVKKEDWKSKELCNDSPKNIEPWLLNEKARSALYSLYLNEPKKQLLLIGNHTIQVWYNYDLEKEKSLEFIYVPISHSSSHRNISTDMKVLFVYEYLSQINVNKLYIEDKIGKFKMEITKRNTSKFEIFDKTKALDDADSNETVEIKMEDENDLMSVAKYACCALKYFSVYKKFEHLFLNDVEKKKFDNIIEQTRKIIWRFIKLHPTTWRLLDIHYDLMSILIDAKEYDLVNGILSFSELVHIPHSFNTIRNALSDHTMLKLLLEYYSNNAINNIGWMNTVVDIIPELYKEEENDNKSSKDVEEKKLSKSCKEKIENIVSKLSNIYKETMENIVSKLFKSSKKDIENIVSKLFKSRKEKTEKEREYYAQKLFSHPCFWKKKLDIFSFDFLEISPKLDGLLKVFIPITQLVPQDTELDLQEIEADKISSDKIDEIRMVPLPNFTTTKMLPDVSAIKNIRERRRIFRNILIFPAISSKYYVEGNCSPFNKIIKDDDFYNVLSENPSMNAVMNWMWFILLGYSYYVGLVDSSESDNPFSSFFGSILAVYNWSSISFAAWNSWPLTLIGVFGSLLFVLVLQNVIITFMGEAVSDAVKSSTSIYKYQVDYIHDFALYERALNANEIDFRFKDKLRAKYICFKDDPSITKSLEEKFEKMNSKSSSKKIPEYGYENLSDENCKFIWEQEKEKIKGKDFWFIED
ncbi:16512_t:CDS:2, partial [Racocetra persica]